MKYCKRCGKEIQENYKICPYCGVMITNKQEKNFCKDCGSKLEADGRCLKCMEKIEIKQEKNFCKDCGSKLEADGSCLKCIEKEKIRAIHKYEVGDEILSYTAKAPKKVNVMALLGFIFAILGYACLYPIDMLFSLGYVYIIIALGIVAIILEILAFIFQFIARKRYCSIVWKIFTWITFGISLLILSIFTIVFTLSFINIIGV